MRAQARTVGPSFHMGASKALFCLSIGTLHHFSIDTSQIKRKMVSMKKAKIDGLHVSVSKGNSVEIVGDFNSNIGRVDNGRLSMDWNYGLTDNVIEWVKENENKV
jgi:hypothetical protein